MSFPAGTCCKRTPAPPRKPPLSSSTPCNTACPFPSGRCRSMAAPSLPPSSNRPASSAAPSVRSSSTFSQTQRCRGTRPSYPPRRVLPGHALLAGNEPAQPRTPPLGKNLQHRPPSSGSRLLDPSPVPPAKLISAKGMKSVTYLLDEYRGFSPRGI